MAWRQSRTGRTDGNNNIRETVGTTGAGGYFYLRVRVRLRVTNISGNTRARATVRWRRYRRTLHVRRDSSPASRKFVVGVTSAPSPSVIVRNRVELCVYVGYRVHITYLRTRV